MIMIPRTKFVRRLLGNMSLKGKLMLAMLTVTTAALSLAAVGLAVNEYHLFKQSMVRRLDTLTNVIAENSASSLIFDYPDAAMQVLAALRCERDVLGAALYEKDGALFASYIGDSTKFALPTTAIQSNEEGFKQNVLVMSKQVMQNGKREGTITIAVGTNELIERMWAFVASMGVIFVVSIAASVLFGLLIQKVVTSPLLRLIVVARRITTTKDISIRAYKVSNDEVGDLVDSFNKMLDEMSLLFQKLQESEERFAIAVNGTDVGIWDWRMFPYSVYFSPRFREMLGWTTENEPQDFEAWMKMIHPLDADRVSSAMTKHFVEHEPFDIEYRIDVAGEYRWFHSKGSAIWDAQGKPVRMAGSLADITEKVHAEENLSRYFSLSTDLMCMVDMQGHFKVVNPAFSQVTGYSETELMERTFSDLLHPDDREKTAEVFEEILSGGRASGFENRYICKDGSIVWLSWNSVIMDSETVFGLARDITEKRLTAEKLREYSEQLRRSNRELEDFATVASHDLQEPLRKVQAFRDRLLIKCGNQLDEQARDYLDRMRDAVDRMKTLITDLLAFSRISSRANPYTIVDLEDTAKGVLSDLEVLIASCNAEVICENLPQVEADPMQMRQLLQNLIGNALKFRKPDSTPKVVIRACAAHRQTNMEEAVHDGGDAYEIVVEDNGIGFDEAYSDKIFKVFQRLHGRGEFEGTGIGLAICRKIVERHGGTIQARSTLGEGSKFIFSLPARQRTQTTGV